MEDGSVCFVWDLVIDMFIIYDYWSFCMDVIIGEELDCINWNVSCNFDVFNGMYVYSYNCEYM